MPRATTRQHGGSPRSTIGVATPDRLLRLTNAKPGGQSQRSDGTEAAPNVPHHGAAGVDVDFERRWRPPHRWMRWLFGFLGLKFEDRFSVVVNAFDSSSRNQAGVVQLR